MITTAVQFVFSGSLKDRLKCLVATLAIDGLIIAGCLPYSDLLNYTR